MSSEMEGQREPLSQIRQLTIDALMEHFANDALEVEEFEQRVDIAHRATSTEELRKLLADLPGPGNLPAVQGGEATGALEKPSYTVTSAARVKDKEYVIAIMGGGSRRGRWSPARKNYAVALMGGAELDFREAVLGPGVTEVQVFAMCGGVDIIVPPGLRVETHGFAIMGAFDHRSDEVVNPDPHTPILRVTGFACMAGVDVSVRHPGESARDARRRRRLERREQRKRLRSGD